MEIKDVEEYMKIKKEKLDKIIDVLQKAYTTGEIEVNDGNGNRVYQIVDKTHKNSILAHLVMEEDESIRFYFNPNEHSDLVIATIPVEYIDYGTLAEEFDSVIDEFISEHELLSDELEKLMVGWIDYKHAKMGELEKQIYKVIKDYK
jgi:hypothetical protein